MTTKETEVRILLSKMYDETRLMITKEKDTTLNRYATDIVELFSIHGVSQQRELLKTFCDYIGVDQLVNSDDMMVDIEEHIRVFNCG